MPHADSARSRFSRRFLRWALLSAAITLGATLAVAKPDRPAPDESARTQVLVVVPSGLNSFVNHQLEVCLYEVDPRDKTSEMRIDRQLHKPFNHNLGAVANLTVNVTVGNGVSLKPQMRYYLTVAAFNPAGKRTHLADHDGKREAPQVLTFGKPNQITLVLREAKPHDVVLDIAEAIKKGDDAKAKKIAEARVKDFEELFEIETLHRRRNKGGMGWGPAPGPNPAQDSLEMKLIFLARGVPQNFVQDVKNNEEAGYWIAALAELTAQKPEFRPVGKKTKEDWNKKARQARIEADSFIRAIASQNLLAIRNSAQNVLNSCSDCHNVYRD